MACHDCSSRTNPWKVSSHIEASGPARCASLHSLPKARLGLREMAVLHEFSKRVKKARDHLMKIYHFSCIPDLLHPNALASSIVHSHDAAFCCRNDLRLQLLERLVPQDSLVQLFHCFISVLVLRRRFAGWQRRRCKQLNVRPQAGSLVLL